MSALGKTRRTNRNQRAGDRPAIDRLRRATGVFQTRIDFGRGVIVLSIHPDGHPVNTVFACAERVVDNIDALSERGRELAAVEALETYNADWRFGERPAGAGIVAMSEAPVVEKIARGTLSA